LSTHDFPEKIPAGKRAEVVKRRRPNQYLLPPLPNTLYTRDTTCWIYAA